MIKFLIVKVAVFSIALFLFAPTTNAAVIISEIMYDPAGNDAGSGSSSASREWIEIKNDGDIEIDVSSLKFRENDTDHGLALKQGSVVLPPGGYAIIASSDQRFLEDFPAYSGALFDSSFSLSNEGEALVIKYTGDVIIDSVTYEVAWGGKNDGNSLQKSGGSFIAALPTPGGGTSAGSTPFSVSSSTPATPSSNTNQSSNWPVEQQIFANAGPDKTATVGADMVFEGKALGLEKKPIENARFLWNFGDGTTKEGKSVLYAYKYPGEYIVVLDVSSGYFSASDRVLIKAENSKIIISSLGTSQNNFIELTNPSNYDIDISLWMLRSGMTTFFLPARTYIAGNKKLIFASDTTKIIPQKGERVELLYPNGSLATLFELSGAGKNIVSSGSANSNRAPAPLVIENTVKSAVTPEGGTTSQMAAAVNPLAQNSAPSTYKWLLGLAAVALVSIFGVSYASYSPRTKKESAPQAKDFKIIEEE